MICTEQPGDICYVAAGAVSLRERAVADLDALASVLTAAGAERGEVSRVVRALRPLADGGAPAGAQGLGQAVRRLFKK